MTAPLAGQGPAMLMVLAGGMLGAPARYGVETLLPGSGGIPWATFLVNVGGALVLGLLLESLVLAGDDTGSRRRWRLFLGTGFCGAFTTYSSFAVQLVELGRDGRAGVALGYAAASLATGLAATVLGIAAAHAARRAAGGAR